MIKLTHPPVEILNEEGEKTGHLSCVGEVDGYIFYHVIPPEHTKDRDIVQAYLESHEAKIRAKAIIEDGKRAKERLDIFAPRNIEAEVDELKGKVTVLEERQKPSPERI